jgi:hypothetical protein
MKSKIIQRLCAPAALIAVAAAAISLSTAPVMLAPASASALPIQGVKKCDPGDIKTENGKKYVCDKNGHWIHVVSLTAGTVVGGPIRGVSATTTVTLSGGFRMLEANGGGTTVTCGLGSKPGDYMEERTYIFRNGQRIGFNTTTYICGKDGAWHTVAALVTHGGTLSAVGTVTIQGVRP